MRFLAFGNTFCYCGLVASQAFAIVAFIDLGILVVVLFLIRRAGASRITSAHALFENPRGSAADRARAADDTAATATASNGARFDNASSDIQWGALDIFP